MALTVATVALTTVTLSLTAPWTGGQSFIDKALAAIGSDRYVHAVVEPAGFGGVIVDLKSGRERRLRQTISYWLDSKTQAYSALFSVNGVAVDSEIAGGEPALAAFARGYRAALRNSEAKVIGETTVAGHKAKIIRFTIFGFVLPGGDHAYTGGNSFEDVAVDARTYRPLWFRQGGKQQDGTTGYGPQTKVLSISSSSTSTSAEPKPFVQLDGSATTIRAIAPTDAGKALGHKALWPGWTLNGFTFRAALLQRVTTSRYPVVVPALRSGLGVRLIYRHGTQSLTISEAPTAQAGYGFPRPTRSFSGRIPPTGSITLTCPGCAVSSAFSPWTGQLHTSGLYITIFSPTRNLAIATARALRELP
ncbi:MAG TPA: hypothetical protein VFM96_04520 [Gaiellaceae bacterium]|nr:hypothetical protein [Gaiellaceae bacterium]